MRGNGLSAAAYVAVADLDPHTADALLDALRDRGVAAYAAASPDPAGGPHGDVDRLYVDVAAVEQARALIAAGVAGGIGDDVRDGTGQLDDREPDDLMGRDVDAEFAAIVAGFHTAEVDRLWPVGEDLRDDMPDDVRDPPSTRPDAGKGDAQGPGGASTAGPSSGWDDLLGSPPAEAAAEPEVEEGYVPPPPPPLPRGDARTWAAWVAVAGGPAVLFGAVLLGWHLDDWVMLLAAASFLVGFVALVARLGDRPDDEDDDGAVV